MAKINWTAERCRTGEGSGGVGQGRGVVVRVVVVVSDEVRLFEGRSVGWAWAWAWAVGLVLGAWLVVMKWRAQTPADQCLDRRCTLQRCTRRQTPEAGRQTTEIEAGARNKRSRACR